MENLAAAPPADADGAPKFAQPQPARTSLFRRLVTCIEVTGSFLWRSPYSMGLTLLSVTCLCVVAQGHELLRILNQHKHGVLKLLPWAFGLLAWALAAWYCARINLARDFGEHSLVDRSHNGYANWLRTWLPRLMAILPGTAIGITALAIGAHRVGAVSLGVGVVMGIFVTQRRRLLADHSDPTERKLVLDPLSRNILASALLLAALLFLLIYVWPLATAKVLPAATLLCLAIACWIVFGDTLLVYAFKQANLPSFALLPFFLFLATSSLNDNHALAKLDAAGPQLERQELQKRFDLWIEARQKSGEIKDGAPYPVFLVSAAGGGIRAAQWTALVLARLQDETQGRFGDHVFAISGVSGGSLGATVFASLMAEQAAGKLSAMRCAAAQAPYQSCANTILDQDFLSPMVGYMLYPDLVQRFLPWKVNSFDRSRAIEQAWGTAWRQATDTNRLAEHFDQLWAGAPDRVPSLLLNATLVGEGNRVIASNMRIEDKTFIGAYDFFSSKLDTQRTSLATAVHNSARFAYVSPAGLVHRADGSQWGRVIDGGYFENSGVETVRDIWAKLKTSSVPGVYFVIIEIVNDPLARSPDNTMDPANASPTRDFLHEVSAPILGLFNTRTARASFAERGSRRDAGAAQVHRFDMNSQAEEGVDPDTDVPLGWALSTNTRAKVLNRSKQLDSRFKQLASTPGL